MLDLGHLALLCNKAYYLYSYYVCADSLCVDFLVSLVFNHFCNFVLADKQNNVILKSGWIFFSFSFSPHVCSVHVCVHVCLCVCAFCTKLLYFKLSAQLIFWHCKWMPVLWWPGDLLWSSLMYEKSQFRDWLHILVLLLFLSRDFSFNGLLPDFFPQSYLNIFHHEIGFFKLLLLSS